MFERCPQVADFAAQRLNVSAQRRGMAAALALPQPAKFGVDLGEERLGPLSHRAPAQA